MPKAAKDLRQMVRFVSQHDPEAAHRLRVYLVQELKLTANFAQAARMVPEIGRPEIRELIRSPS
jgi:plasmid stabilization system protein ParE